MKEISLTGKILLAFTLPLAVAYHFLVIPQIKATSQAVADVETLRTTGTAVASAKAREDFKAKLEAVKKESNILLPAADEQYDITVQVEALARDKQLTISNLGVNAALPTNLQKTTKPTTSGDDETAPAAASAAPTSLKVTISLGVVGTYAQIQDLVKSLPALDRFIQIEQVSFVATGDDPSQLNASITAFAYYLPAVKTP